MTEIISKTIVNLPKNIPTVQVLTVLQFLRIILFNFSIFAITKFVAGYFELLVYIKRRRNKKQRK